MCKILLTGQIPPPPPFIAVPNEPTVSIAISSDSTAKSTAGDPRSSEAGTKHLVVIIAGSVLGLVLVIALIVSVVVIVSALINRRGEFKPKPVIR